jgi:tRNA-dihydrouridine synthase A
MRDVTERRRYHCSMTSSHRLCIAPMMERTDRHFRFLVRLLSARTRLYTEMVTARALLHGDRDWLLAFHPDEHPVALQLGGADPDELAAAAKMGEAAGYDEINLNVGCPSGRVQAGCFGVALMLEPDRVVHCIDAMRAAVRVPVTVKTRLGVDDHDSYEFLHAFVAKLAAAGCGTLVLHARKAWLNGLSPKENREVPPLDYARVYRVKNDFPQLNVVINGGLTDVGASLAHLQHVDGIMLGRAAYQNPWILAELDAQMSPSPVRIAFDRMEIVGEFLDYVAHELRAGTPLKAMTRHLMGLYCGQPGGRHWRRQLSELADGRAGLELLQQLARGESSAATRVHGATSNWQAPAGEML